MAVSSHPPTRSRLPRTTDELGVSRYDQVAGLLVAVLLVLGFVTFMMFLVWLSSRVFRIQAPAAVTVLEDVGGGGSGDVAAGEQQLDEPSPEELQEVVDPPIEQSIQAISDVVSTEAESLEAFEGATSFGQGDGDGQGDGRNKGPGGPGTSDGIPAWERWEVRMKADQLAEYARQLDFFQVELGVAGGGNPNVEYISNLSAAKPTVRIGSPKEEKRLRFLHQSGELRLADRELAAKAGINSTGRIVFQFYSPAMYQKLLTLENAKLGNRRIRDVRRTVFGVRGSSGRYELYVIDQQYIN